MKKKEIIEVASLKKSSKPQSKSSDGNHNSKVAKQAEDVQFVKSVRKRLHSPTQLVKPQKRVRRPNLRVEANQSTALCHGYAFKGPISDLYDEAKHPAFKKAFWNSGQIYRFCYRRKRRETRLVESYWFSLEGHRRVSNFLSRP